VINIANLLSADLDGLAEQIRRARYRIDNDGNCHQGHRYDRAFVPELADLVLQALRIHEDRQEALLVQQPVGVHQE